MTTSALSMISPSPAAQTGQPAFAPARSETRATSRAETSETFTMRAISGLPLTPAVTVVSTLAKHIFATIAKEDIYAKSLRELKPRVDEVVEDIYAESLYDLGPNPLTEQEQKEIDELYSP